MKFVYPFYKGDKPKCRIETKSCILFLHKKDYTSRRRLDFEFVKFKSGFASKYSR